MTEWIGHLIASWPSWMMLPTAIIAAILLLVGYMYIHSWPFVKREWWQDREARLKKEQTHPKKKFNTSRMKKG